MSNEKFTPGPWVVIKLFRQETGALAIVHDQSGDTVTICDVIDDKDHPEIADADAALISAAPEMYALLSKCSSCINYLLHGVVDSPVIGESENTMIEIKELLKKARGEE